MIPSVPAASVVARREPQPRQLRPSVAPQAFATGMRAPVSVRQADQDARHEEEPWGARRNAERSHFAPTRPIQAPAALALETQKPAVASGFL